MAYPMLYKKADQNTIVNFKINVFANFIAKDNEIVNGVSFGYTVSNGLSNNIVNGIDNGLPNTLFNCKDNSKLMSYPLTLSLVYYMLQPWHCGKAKSLANRIANRIANGIA